MRLTFEFTVYKIYNKIITHMVKGECTMQQNDNTSFFHMVWRIALPVALQSMLQASFGIVDQIMIGRLGGISIAGVGLAAKFASLYSVIIAAVGTAAGIMAAQYIGQESGAKLHRSLFINLWLAVGIAFLFTLLCILFPGNIMGLYTQEADTAMRDTAASYLSVYALSFMPAAVITLVAVLFRCMEKASLPLYVGLASAFLNTVLNYVLIFGRFGFPLLGVKGAAIASVISQTAGCLLIILMFMKWKRDLVIWNESKTNTLIRVKRRTEINIAKEKRADMRMWWKQYMGILVPILVCEFFWSLGENVYAGIYGHLGTDACAAMTMTNPVQGLAIGALCGLSQAAGIIIGKMLGCGEYEEAYNASKKLIVYGIVGSVILSLLVFLTRPYYVLLYKAEEEIRSLTKQILIAYALIVPLKVSNMILGGGIIRSGGKTGYIMGIDLIGTWLFGVPLGLFAAFYLELPIPWVYFMLSLEEGVRFLISLVVFCRKRWMRSF